MEFKSNTYILKSSNKVRIRIAVIEDAQNLIDLKRSYIKGTTTIPMNLDEYPDHLENEMKIISAYDKSPNSILLVAEFNNELIGNIDLTGSERAKMFHTGMIGMGIKEKWRNQGLGKFLMEAVINWAKKHSALELIWLDVYASNDLGMNLYKNTGFKVSGIITDFFKEKDGYKDKVQMYLSVKEGS